MTGRREFIKLLGLTVSSAAVLNGCGGNYAMGKTNADGEKQAATSDSVIIIGAGAAGMAAGYLLAQNGVDFRILEAASAPGGRMKHDTDFTDFPIPLGGEWLHVDESELAAIVNDSSVDIATKTQGYAANDTYGEYSDGDLDVEEIGYTGLLFARDRKFVDSSWLGFFEQYILPGVQANIAFNTQVTSIDYQGTVIRLLDQHGQVYNADKVIVTVPAKVLQNGDVTFIPALPENKLSTLQEAEIWGGFKCFMAFSEKFYPTFLELTDVANSADQHLYYDAAYAQKTSANILGLFSVGAAAEPYQALSGGAQRDYILNELDEVFDGKASQTYLKHIVQNWNTEPYIQSAYLAGNAPTHISQTLATPIDQKIYFAGEAYTYEDDWGGVHNAARSAKDAVEELLGDSV